MSQAISPPLSDFMRHPLVTLRPFHTVSEALDVAREHHVHHFPVMDHERVVGVVSKTELREAALGETVGRIMRHPVTLPAKGTATEAALLMRWSDVGSVLLTDETGQLCGIVTRRDLVEVPRAAAVLNDCRCEVCGLLGHLRYQNRWLCSSCAERAEEPQAFETGGGD